jgi:ABC-type hemin transport system ATPase subunit
VVLDGGRVVGDGPASEVLAPDRIREVFGVDPSLVRLPDPHAAQTVRVTQIPSGDASI